MKSAKMCILLFLLLTGCGKNPEVAKQLKLNGINGTAYYIFNREGTDIEYVQKIEYLGNPKYNIGINKDTLKVGDTFSASIYILNENYQIFITDPVVDTIRGSYDFSGKMHEPHSYSYVAVMPGLYSFKCIIQYDSISVPVEYKFFVIKDY